MTGSALAARSARVRSLHIGGVTPFTNIDFPGRLAMVVFVQGCPWRCGYCHNPHLQSRVAAGEDSPEWAHVLELLARRRGLLDAVVFSGGEPTVDAGLATALADVRRLGFETGLHTAGIYPGRLVRVLGGLDWIGFDIKAPLGRPAVFDRVTGVAGSVEAVRESAQIVLRSGVSCEFRTTAHPELLRDEDLLDLAGQLASMGATTYALQVARPTAAATLEAVGADYPAPATLSRLAELFPDFTLRRA